MKVLFVITGLDVGGAERQVMDLSEKLIQKGNSVTVAYFLGEQKLKNKNNKVEIVSLGKKRKSFFAFVFGFFSLITLINRIKPDVVHAHMFHSIIIARFSRIFTRIPKLVCTSHSSYDGGKMRMFAYRITSFLGDVFTNVSQKAVDNLESRKAARKGTMIAVLNGISVDSFRYSPEKRAEHRLKLGGNNKKLILAVGRFHEAKDYPNLLNAFSLICNNRNDVELWIVGDGPLKKKIELLISELKLHDTVKLLGIRNDIPDLMSAADVYALSSAWEGFGLVVAEAMATERVVVATDCGGVKEVVGDCGFLVPISNSTLLAEAIENAISLSETARRELGCKARLRIESNYSIGLVTQKWLAIYSGAYK